MRIVRRGWQAQESGFSLLEVLIAVVVLSVGLLALAALQGSLTRASAEAKVRGRVCRDARGTHGRPAPRRLRHADAGRRRARVRQHRGQRASDCDPASPDAQDWLDCARTQANLGELRTVQEIRTWQGTSTFGQSVPANDSIPQFKRILLTASWTDTENLTRTMQLVSDVSSMALTNNIIVPPEPTETGAAGPSCAPAAPLPRASSRSRSARRATARRRIPSRNSSAATTTRKSSAPFQRAELHATGHVRRFVGRDPEALRERSRQVPLPLRRRRYEPAGDLPDGAVAGDLDG
jgi:prepilin-type N-terminal cleavage/methylation domain-containing protein